MRPGALTVPQHDADFPVEAWLRVRVLPRDDGLPRAVRMRKALKCLLRAYGVQCQRLTPTKPAEVGEMVEVDEDDLPDEQP
jgi:hypothetical protein